MSKVCSLLKPSTSRKGAQSYHDKHTIPASREFTHTNINLKK